MTTQNTKIEMPQQEAEAEPNLSGNGELSNGEGRQYPCKILSISAHSNDHDALRAILKDPDWQITCAGSFHQAIGCLWGDRPAAIVCDCHLTDGNWRDLLGHVAELMDPPLLIVTCEAADQTLLAEVLTLGGYDVLSKPFQADEVRRVLNAAWRQRATYSPVGI